MKPTGQPGGDKARELGALAFDRIEQARIRERDRSLISECLDELELLVWEPPGCVPSNRECAD